MEIEVEGDEIIDIEDTIDEFKDANKELARDFMRITLNEIRRSADAKFEDFTGELSDQISMRNVREERTGDDNVNYVLQLGGETPRNANYIAWHEFAQKGHWVNVSNENTPIHKWAKDNLTGDLHTLFVEPQGPFIRPAISRADMQIKNRLNDPNNPLGNL